MPLGAEFNLIWHNPLPPSTILRYPLLLEVDSILSYLHISEIFFSLLRWSDSSHHVPPQLSRIDSPYSVALGQSSARLVHLSR